MITLASIEVEVASNKLASVEFFEAQPGIITAIGGASGCGKTTLLKQLSGALRMSGDVTIDDARLTQSELRRRAYRTIQSFPLFHWLTIGQTLRMAVADKDIDEGAIIDSLRKAQVEHLLERSVSNLSGGERARVTLAIAFALKSDVLLLDEPFTALDPPRRKSIAELLFSTSTENKTYTFFTSHNTDEIARYAQRCLVFSKGRVVEVDPKNADKIVSLIQ